MRPHDLINHWHSILILSASLTSNISSLMERLPYTSNQEANEYIIVTTIVRIHKTVMMMPMTSTKYETRIRMMAVMVKMILTMKRITTDKTWE